MFNDEEEKKEDNQINPLDEIHSFTNKSAQETKSTRASFKRRTIRSGTKEKVLTEEEKAKLEQEKLQSQAEAKNDKAFLDVLIGAAEDRWNQERLEKERIEREKREKEERERREKEEQERRN
ncbi:MAG: hypothetical protein MJ252_13550 [archaeon]|nr:hypothetical protein [archaeon]